MTENPLSEMSDNQGLKSLADLGNELIVELGIQEELEKEIAASKLKTTRLSDVTIPEKMAELGLEEIKLKSGHKLALQPVFGSSIPDVRKPEAWKWLRDNGYGSLIKTTLGCAFGMGEEDEARRTIALLEDQGISFKSKEDVHASTLKSFVTEQYENGKTFPEALFGAFTKTIARIKTK